MEKGLGNRVLLEGVISPYYTVRAVVPLVWFESRTGKTFTVEYDTDDSMQVTVKKMYAGFIWFN